MFYFIYDARESYSLLVSAHSHRTYTIPLGRAKHERILSPARTAKSRVSKVWIALPGGWETVLGEKRLSYESGPTPSMSFSSGSQNYDNLPAVGTQTERKNKNMYFLYESWRLTSDFFFGINKVCTLLVVKRSIINIYRVLFSHG